MSLPSLNFLQVSIAKLRTASPDLWSQWFENHRTGYVALKNSPHSLSPLIPSLFLSYCIVLNHFTETTLEKVTRNLLIAKRSVPFLSSLVLNLEAFDVAVYCLHSKIVFS